MDTITLVNWWVRHIEDKCAAFKLYMVERRFDKLFIFTYSAKFPITFSSYTKSAEGGFGWSEVQPNENV